MGAPKPVGQGNNAVPVPVTADVPVKKNNDAESVPDRDKSTFVPVLGHDGNPILLAAKDDDAGRLSSKRANEQIQAFLNMADKGGKLIDALHVFIGRADNENDKRVLLELAIDGLFRLVENKRVYKDVGNAIGEAIAEFSESENRVKVLQTIVKRYDGAYPKSPVKIVILDAFETLRKTVKKDVFKEAFEYVQKLKQNPEKYAEDDEACEMLKKYVDTFDAYLADTKTESPIVTAYGVGEVYVSGAEMYAIVRPENVQPIVSDITKMWFTPETRKLGWQWKALMAVADADAKLPDKIKGQIRPDSRIKEFIMTLHNLVATTFSQRYNVATAQEQASAQKRLARHLELEDDIVGIGEGGIYRKGESPKALHLELLDTLAFSTPSLMQKPILLKQGQNSPPVAKTLYEMTTQQVGSVKELGQLTPQKKLSTALDVAQAIKRFAYNPDDLPERSSEQTYNESQAFNVIDGLRNVNLHDGVKDDVVRLYYNFIDHNGAVRNTAAKEGFVNHNLPLVSVDYLIDSDDGYLRDSSHAFITDQRPLTGKTVVRIDDEEIEEKLISPIRSWGIELTTEVEKQREIFDSGKGGAGKGEREKILKQMIRTDYELYRQRKRDKPAVTADLSARPLEGALGGDAFRTINHGVSGRALYMTPAEGDWKYHVGADVGYAALESDEWTWYAVAAGGSLLASDMLTVNLTGILGYETVNQRFPKRGTPFTVVKQNEDGSFEGRVVDGIEQFNGILLGISAQAVFQIAEFTDNGNIVDFNVSIGMSMGLNFLIAKNPAYRTLDPHSGDQIIYEPGKPIYVDADEGATRSSDVEAIFSYGFMVNLQLYWGGWVPYKKSVVTPRKKIF